MTGCMRFRNTGIEIKTLRRRRKWRNVSLMMCASNNDDKQVLEGSLLPKTRPVSERQQLIILITEYNTKPQCMSLVYVVSPRLWEEGQLTN